MVPPAGEPPRGGWRSSRNTTKEPRGSPGACKLPRQVVDMKLGQRGAPPWWKAWPNPNDAKENRRHQQQQQEQQQQQQPQQGSSSGAPYRSDSATPTLSWVAARQTNETTAATAATAPTGCTLESCSAGQEDYPLYTSCGSTRPPSQTQTLSPSVSPTPLPRPPTDDRNLDDLGSPFVGRHQGLGLPGSNSGGRPCSSRTPGPAGRTHTQHHDEKEALLRQPLRPATAPGNYQQKQPHHQLHQHHQHHQHQHQERIQSPRKQQHQPRPHDSRDEHQAHRVLPTSTGRGSVTMASHPSSSSSECRSKTNEAPLPHSPRKDHPGGAAFRRGRRRPCAPAPMPRNPWWGPAGESPASNFGRRLSVDLPGEHLERLPQEGRPRGADSPAFVAPICHPALQDPSRLLRRGRTAPPRRAHTAGSPLPSRLSGLPPTGQNDPLGVIAQCRRLSVDNTQGSARNGSLSPPLSWQSDPSPFHGSQLQHARATSPEVPMLGSGFQDLDHLSPGRLSPSASPTASDDLETSLLALELDTTLPHCMLAPLDEEEQLSPSYSELRSRKSLLTESQEPVGHARSDSHGLSSKKGPQDAPMTSSYTLSLGAIAPPPTLSSQNSPCSARRPSYRASSTMPSPPQIRSPRKSMFGTLTLGQPSKRSEVARVASPEADTEPSSRNSSKMRSALDIGELELVWLAKKHKMEVFEVRDRLADFRKYDEDECGTLNAEQYAEALRCQLDLEEDEELPRPVQAEVDRIGEGNASFEDYLEWTRTMAFSHQPSKSDQADSELRFYAWANGLDMVYLEKILAEFRRWDHDHSGQLSKAEFAPCLRMLMKSKDDFDIPQDRVDRFWKEIDRNGDGKVGILEFVVWYLKLFPVSQEQPDELPASAVYRRLSCGRFKQ